MRCKFPCLRSILYTDLVKAGDDLLGFPERSVGEHRGRAVASWKIAAREVVLEPFERLARTDAAELRDEADDVLRYLALGSVGARQA